MSFSSFKSFGHQMEIPKLLKNIIMVNEFLKNESFEFPNIDGLKYYGTFTQSDKQAFKWISGGNNANGGSGPAISDGGTGFGFPNYINGEQALAMQSTSFIEQTIYLVAGTYEFSLYYMGRGNGPVNPIQIFINQELKTTITQQVSGWTLFTHTFDILKAENKTLRLEGTSNGDITTGIDLVALSRKPVITTNGVKSINGLYTIYTFKSSGYFSFDYLPDFTILSVGGGGCGGQFQGGGGGGGAVKIIDFLSSNDESLNINIGAGGGSTNNTNGNDTTVIFSNNSNNNITSIGGGRGGDGQKTGSNGGSGGGNGRDRGNTNGGIGDPGKNGGVSQGSAWAGGSGGGGASLNGGAGGGSGGGGGEYAGSGGDGVQCSLNGLYYGGGGGGSNHGTSTTTVFIQKTSTTAASISGPGLGGLGGGGTGRPIGQRGDNGVENTGGGGGGDSINGGSGIVVIGYLTNYR
jgi:hypothetical protein